METTKAPLLSETVSFIHNHQLLCGVTLGLAVAVYAIGNLAGRTVAWIKNCYGIAKKADDIKNSMFLGKSSVFENPSDSSLLNKKITTPLPPVATEASIASMFEELIQRGKQCVSFREPRVQGEIAFNNFARSVRVGRDAGEAALVFIKRPWGKHAKTQKRLLKNDQVSFQISHALGLHVVPTTKVVSVKQTALSTKDDSPCVLQKAVSISPNQMHLASAVNAEALKSLDIPHIHRAIIFNMLLGRNDGRPINSVIDEQMRIMEVDNEAIGSRTTNSWLLEAFKETTLSDDVVERFLRFEKKTLLDVLKDMESQGLAIEEKSQQNILYNFDRIHAFFDKNQHEKIRVFDLIAMNK